MASIAVAIYYWANSSCPLVSFVDEFLRSRAAIDVAPALDDGHEGELLFDRLTGVCADPFAQTFVLKERVGSACKRDDVADGHEIARFAVADHLAQAWHIERHDRLTLRHRVQCALPTAVRLAGDPDHRGRAEVVRDVGMRAEKVDVGDAQQSDERAHKADCCEPAPTS